MYPEDRVLVAYMSDPADFALTQNEGWYRVPQRHAPKGIYAEYFAFYFGRRFGPEKWAIHYYARRLGHELMPRRLLFPDQPDHPRADDPYYKVQLAPLQRLERPIISLRWRRITFLHTTWDRFQDATEINDLFLDGGDYVNRVVAALKERGIQAERDYRVEECGHAYQLTLAVRGRQGWTKLSPVQLPVSDQSFSVLADVIEKEMDERGFPG
jgi:hypothetical protein